MDAHPLGTATSVGGRLVLDDRVASGRISIEDGGSSASTSTTRLDAGDPYIAPGSSTSTSTAGAATTRWATRPTSTGMARASCDTA